MLKNIPILTAVTMQIADDNSYVCLEIGNSKIAWLIISRFTCSLAGGPPPWVENHIPVVPARGGAEAALDLTISSFSSIEITRAVRRACVLWANLLCGRFPRT